MGAPFIFKMSFYTPGDGNEAKNVCHILYIGTRPGADRGEGDVEIGDKESYFHYKSFMRFNEAAKHVKYTAERPRSHGLFGPDMEKVPELEAVQSELWSHKGIVWRAVLSLREDDAVRMGYANRKAWEDALRASVPEAAGKMGISESNLRWVAAFHAEPGHPHCHLVFWETEPERSRGVLSMGKSKDGGELKDVRRVFVQRIFAGERARLGAEKTALRDLIRDFGKGSVRELINDVKTIREDVRAIDGAAAGVAPRMSNEARAALNERLEQIAGILPGKGRIALKYMPPEVKEKLHEAADWLLKQPGFSDSVQRYVEIAKEMAGHYSMIDDKLEEAGRKAYEDLRDRLSQDILKGAVEVGKLERDAESFIDDRMINDSDVEPPDDRDMEEATDSFDGLSLEDVAEPLCNDLDDDGQSSSAAGVTQVSGNDVKKVSDSLLKDSWRTVDRAIFQLDSGAVRGKMPAVSADLEKNVAEELKKIAGLIPDEALKGRIALAYLPSKVKDEARGVAEQLLNSGELALRTEKYMQLVVAGGGEDAGSEAFRELRERVAEQVVGRAAELLPREIPQVEMLPHDGRVENAIDRLKSATADYICGDADEMKWTAGVMYRSLIRLGVDGHAARETTENWADSVGLKEEAGRAITKEVSLMNFISKKNREKGKPGPQHVSRKDWTRLRENLGLEEEEYLYPWFGVVQQQEQLPEQEVIPHELVEKRISSAVSALETASGKPDNYAEVYWTIRTFTNTLQVLGVGEDERERIVRGWGERSGLEISEARLRDVLDRVTVLPKDDFWLGRTGWIRLNVNLGVTIPAAAPWKVNFEHTVMGADKNKVAGDLWRDVWHSSERAIYRIKSGIFEKTPAIENDFRDMIADKLNTIASLIPEESLKGRLALAYLPGELKDEVRSFTEQLLNSGKLALRTEKFMQLVVAGQGEDAGSEAFRELRERVAEQVVGRAAELLPREIPQVEMLPHDGRIQDAIERLENANAEYIRGDVDEVKWTTGAMYRSLIRLGVDSQEARQVSERWAVSAGLKEVEVARAVTEESIKMACIAEECREENKPEPVHVSRRDWTRLQENLGLEEEECLYPWFGVVREQEQSLEKDKQQNHEVIPHMLVENRISPAVHALETASKKPENYAEVQWTIRTLVNTLQALGVGDEDRTRIVNGWVEKSGLKISEARLRDVLDRVTVLPKDDFWLGRASWKRLTENIGLNNPPSSPWRVIVDRSGNIAGQVWKAVWRATERERTKLEAKRIMHKRLEDLRWQRVKERSK